MNIQFYLVEIDAPDGLKTIVYHGGFGPEYRLAQESHYTKLVRSQLGTDVKFNFIMDHGNKLTKERFPEQYDLFIALAMKYFAPYN